MHAESARPDRDAAAPARIGVLLQLVMVTAGYYACGAVGLLLAIPPGYATAVWPASGVALAAVLLGGGRLAIGVWIGSFLLNTPTAYDVAAPLASLGVPAAIAFGAAAQALVGAWMIRRWVGYTNLLLQELDVIRLLLLGGPVACVVSCSVGVASLVAAGGLAGPAIWLNLWTWWVGDSIGVLVFAPLVLVWAVRPYAIWLQRQLFVTIPLIALFATVVALFVFVSQREYTRIQADFHGFTTELGQQMQKELGTTLGALGALEGFYASSERVDQYEFEIFASRLMHVLPGARALAWLEHVTGEERAAFERSGRAAGLPRFRLQELGAEGLVPAGARSEYVVARYVVPQATNELLLGFDAMSEPGRRSALEEARDTGRVIATGRVKLVSSRSLPGLLAFMPVYRHGVQPSSIVARRRYLEGFAVAIFPLEALMEGTRRVADSRGIGLRLYDDAASGRAELIYGSEAGADASGLRNELRFNFAGRPLRMVFHLPEQALLGQRSWETWLVLAGGLLLTSLVGMLLLLGVGRAARVESIVDERTAELRRLNADLVAEAARRRRLETEAEKRAGELYESNAELQRRAEVNRQLLRSLRHSEGELRRTASQLASSNRELEQFAYVASHDLKAPLRSIGSFAQLLERRHGAQLGEEAREFLGFIHDGIRQMQVLIDDLLQLSRVDPRRLEPAPVSMQTIVDRACRQLTADLKASHADVQTGPLPEVHADANMLVQLLQNLISNGIKFQKPGNPAQIRIEAVAEGDYWHFTVADNGIGIDPQHLGVIFMVFKRLHTSDQFPGSGIGLAICKKVVSLHGGEIWADSRPGAGTTFHFTLPRKIEPEPPAA